MKRNIVAIIGCRSPSYNNQTRRMVRHASKSWIYTRPIVNKATHCLVTVDPLVGLWTTAACQKMRLPYTVVKPFDNYQSIIESTSNKYIQQARYYCNRAAKTILLEENLTSEDVSDIWKNFTELMGWKYKVRHKVDKIIDRHLHILHRNKWMIDRADHVIILCNMQYTTVAYWTAQYAMSKEISSEVIEIDPMIQKWRDQGALPDDFDDVPF